MAKIRMDRTMVAGGILVLVGWVASNPVQAVPPFELIRSDYAVGELVRICDASIAKASQRLEAVSAMSSPQQGSALLAFEETLADLEEETNPLTFMGVVGTSEELQAESFACEEKVGQFTVDVFTRKALYEAIRRSVPQGQEEQRLYDEHLRNFETNGLRLDEAKLAKVKELKQRLASLEAQFNANLNNDQTRVLLTAEELEGVPESILSRLRKSDDGRYIVTANYSDYFPISENARKVETRKRVMGAYLSRAAEANTRLLEEAILVRQEVASIMGFETWADYRINGRMAKDAQTALAFLNGLKDKLAQRNQADLNKLLAFLREEDPSITRVGAWDVNYAAYQIKKREFSLDEERIREYFPTETVIQGMFDVFQRLLGVTFHEIKGAKTWHPQVKLFEVRDASSGDRLSYFYMDLYPRAGKYGHAAAFTVIRGRKIGTSYKKPVSSIVSNFNPPANGKPSLLNHEEVETLFHEFGHIMHQTLTQAPFASLSGTRVSRDFVEAPSQVFENWVWSKEILASVSGHYLNPEEKLPDELLSQMLAARDFNRGYFYTRQLMLALMDMIYHMTSGPVDTTAIQDRLYREISGIDPLPGGRYQAGFVHLMGGYDAGVYSYLWSGVYSADMFTRFEEKGLLNPEEGMRYRKNILESGNMRDSLTHLEEFLGRKASSDAFYRYLGIQTE